MILFSFPPWFQTDTFALEALLERCVSLALAKWLKKSLHGSRKAAVTEAQPLLAWVKAGAARSVAGVVSN